MDPGVALILQGIQGRKRDIEIQEVTPDPRDTSSWEGRSTATTLPWDGKLRGAIPSSIPGATSSDKSLFWECGRGSTKSRRSWQFRQVGGASLPFTPWESYSGKSSGFHRWSLDFSRNSSPRGSQHPFAREMGRSSSAQSDIPWKYQSQCGKHPIHQLGWDLGIFHREEQSRGKGWEILGSGNLPSGGIKLLAKAEDEAEFPSH